MRIDGYAPIRDYALIGDGRTAALVARDGSIDWLCVPDVDSPAIFARILDSEKGGSFRLEPEVDYEVERRYVGDSNVLETTFRTGEGIVRVTDAMTLTDTHVIAPLRELVRKIECVEGRVRLRYVFEPRFEYGARTMTIDTRGGRFVVHGGKDAVALAAWGAGTAEVRGGAVHGDVDLSAGKTAVLTVAATHQEPLIYATRADVERRLERTVRFWEDWAGRIAYNGPWRDAVVRSALALKLLVFAPSGAIVAAPTASLPEWIGGGRNWDYRYSWLRDASWTTDALLRLGFADEARAFFWWFMHASRLTEPELHVFYRVDGSIHAPELELPLAGYRRSSPVRIGNGAATQVQLDTYGDVLESVWLLARETNELDRATGKDVAAIADHVATHWRKADSSIWEVRRPETHFTQSKAFCWVALDRACRLAEHGYIPDRREKWRAAADEIRRYIDDNCWDEQRRTYIRAPDLHELDASLLTLAIMSYDDPKGERMNGVIDAVARDLRNGPFVHRYLGEDGVGGEEGAFLTCSFWLVDALAGAGRLDEATSLFEELIALGNDVGLYAEEVHPATGEFLGNFPQGLTHLALVNAALSIYDAHREAA